MSEFFKVVVLSIVQGLTEFLPVSSSGHLVLAGHFMDYETPGGVTFELLLHVGTLAAVVIFYRKKLTELLLGLFRGKRESVLYAVWVGVSMVPAGICYKAFAELVKAAYASPMFTAGAMCVTGIVLIATALLREDKHTGQCPVVHFTWKQALIMGIAQAVALLPGISRSGSTIAAGRFAGVKAKDAAEFSFIMSIPVIAGAAFLDLVKNHGELSSDQAWQYAVGAAVAGVVGFAAIKWFVGLLSKGKLWMFGAYCYAVGTVVLVILACRM